MIDHFKNLIHALRRSLKIFESGSKKANEKLNLATKKPLNLGGSGGFSVVNTGILTVSSILHNTSQNQVYDAGDVAEGFAHAHDQMLDLAAMLTAIGSEHEKNIEYLQKVHSIPAHRFRDLKRLIRITSVMIDRSIEFNQDQENHYKNQS